ncbi:MAG: hypothetical protein JWN69_1395, partial [Alphaproteobacteria bacterium]|nr:hypothetical protein [Alphaproteobacteria bacterium]
MHIPQPRFVDLRLQQSKEQASPVEIDGYGFTSIFAGDCGCFWSRECPAFDGMDFDDARARAQSFRRIHFH